MPIAVLKNGQIRPLEPLPVDWQEGQCLRVDLADADDATPDQIDRDFATLASLCANSDPADDERLRQALQQAQCQSKEQVRRHMGLA